MTDPSFTSGQPGELSHEAPHTTQPPGRPYADMRRKSPMLALVLSAMPGLGQIYVGYYRRGFVHAIVVAGLIALLSAPGIDYSPIFPLFGLFLAFFWLYNMVDAYRRAALYNHALAGGVEIELPDDISIALPSFRGSIAGGIAIAAVGLILLLNTRFDVSLAWVGEWWPAAILLFGVYLAWKGFEERRRGTERGADGPDEV